MSGRFQPRFDRRRGRDLGRCYRFQSRKSITIDT